MTAPAKFHVAQTPLREGKSDAEHRLKKEGGRRYAEFTKFRHKVRARLLKTKDWTLNAARDEAWAQAIEAFAPIPVEQWTPAVEEKWVAPAPLPERAVAKRLRDVPDYDGSEAGLKAALVWILNHPAMSRPREKDGRVYLRAKDFEGIPHKAAWTLLHTATEESTKFIKEGLDKLIKMFGKGSAAEEASALEDEGLGDLEAALRNLGSANVKVLRPGAEELPGESGVPQGTA